MVIAVHQSKLKTQANFAVNLRFVIIKENFNFY